MGLEWHVQKIFIKELQASLAREETSNNALAKWSLCWTISFGYFDVGLELPCFVSVIN